MGFFKDILNSHSCNNLITITQCKYLDHFYIPVT